MNDHRPSRARWRRLGALLAVAALASLLAACGSDSKDDAGPAADDAPAATDTVTIANRFGPTEIEGVPERIVTLDLQWTDVLVALGTQPVGFAGDSTVDPSGLYPWQTDIADEAEMLPGAVSEIPFEKVAALRPDLILVSYAATEKATFDKLSAIAPTIGMLTETDQVDSWQSMTEAAGKFLHKEDEAAALVESVDAAVKAVGTELPTLKGKTFTLAQYIPGDAIYTVADPADGSSRFFTDLGLVMAPDVIAAGKSQNLPRPKFSGEHVDILSADFLAFFNAGDEATLQKDLPGFDQLPAVRSGAMADATYGLIVALNTPTPLSVRYALKELRPNLEAAAKA